MTWPNIVITPGHTRQSPGAINKTYGLSEHEITKSIIEKVADSYIRKDRRKAGYNLIAFTPNYTHRTYGDCLRAKFNDINEMNPSLILEFHFNAVASDEVVGSEMVSAPDMASRKFAKYMMREFASYHKLLAPDNKARRLFLPRRVVTPQDLGRDIFILDSAKYPTNIVEFSFLSTDVIARQFMDRVFVTELAWHIEDSLFDYARHNLLGD